LISLLNWPITANTKTVTKPKRRSKMKPKKVMRPGITRDITGENYSQKCLEVFRVNDVFDVVPDDLVIDECTIVCLNMKARMLTLAQPTGLSVNAFKLKQASSHLRLDRCTWKGKSKKIILKDIKTITSQYPDLSQESILVKRLLLSTKTGDGRVLFEFDKKGIKHERDKRRRLNVLALTGKDGAFQPILDKIDFKVFKCRKVTAVSEKLICSIA